MGWPFPCAALALSVHWGVALGHPVQFDVFDSKFED